MTPTPLRVVIYAAKSTADEKGSIPQQIADCEAYARSQGWTLDTQESDEAASAWSGSRGRGLERAMSRAEGLAKRHGRAGLLVFHSNRLARGELVNNSDARHLIDYLRWANRANVELHSVNDSATFTNSMVAFVVGEMNAQDSKAKSAAVKRGMRDRRAKRKHPGGAIYGYHRDPEKALRPNPEQAPTVERIFRLIAGGKSQAEVARILNGEGSRPLRGQEWAQGSISKMIQNRTYLGEMQDDGGEWIDALWDAIVSRELWDAANRQREAAARTKGRKGGPRPKAGHLLPGRMLRHAACGSAMTPVSHDAKRDGTVTGVYDCSGRKSGTCDGYRVSMQDVDSAIIGYLSAVGIDADESLKLVREATQATHAATAAELEAARREASRVAAEWDRMWTLFKAGDLDTDDWRRFKAEHEEAKAASAARVARLQAQAEAATAPEAVVPAVADALAIVRTAMANGDADAVRAVLDTLFSAFLIGPLDWMPDQAIIGTAHDAKAARAKFRAQFAAMERKSGRSIAEGERQFWMEQAALDELMPEPEPTEDEPLMEESGGVYIVPQPRADALASGDPVHYVDENGRSVFARLPLLMTNNDGLHK